MDQADDGPRGADGQKIGSVNDDFDIVIPFPLEETENEYHEISYRLSEQEVVHPYVLFSTNSLGPVLTCNTPGTEEDRSISVCCKHV